MSIILNAHPNFYDYYHRLTLNDDKTFEFRQGRHHNVIGTHIGTYSIENDGDTKKLIITYTHKNKQYYCKTKEDLPATCTWEVSYFPCGVIVHEKLETDVKIEININVENDVWKFDKSPNIYSIEKKDINVSFMGHEYTVKYNKLYDEPLFFYENE